MADEVTIFCDGACPSSGIRAWHGGWGAILLFEGQEVEVTGREHPTTNQRMELMSLIGGLAYLTRPMKVKFYSDSKYLVDGTNSWLARWPLRKWRNASGKPIENKDLWEKILAYKRIHHITGSWVEGHVPIYRQTYEHQMNARADRLAFGESENMLRELTSPDSVV